MVGRGVWVAFALVAMHGCATPTEAIPGNSEGSSADTPASTGGATDPTDPTTPTDPSAATTTGATDPTDPTGAGDDTTGEPATDSGAPASPECGDMVVQEGEACDDGNDDDTDDCTTLCQPPACDDGIVSGDETDVDCGGTCDPCAMGSSCTSTADCGASMVCPTHNSICQLPPSCLYVLELDPAATDGDYDLDPNADGVTESFSCEMDYEGGGWTQIDAEFYAGPADPGWSNTTITNCGRYQVLGGFDVLGAGDTLTRTFDLLGVPHTESLLSLNVLFIDSWDGENFTAQIDATEVINHVPDPFVGRNICGGGWNDEQIILRGFTAHAANTADVSITSTLDQPTDDESWGINATRFFVR